MHVYNKAQQVSPEPVFNFVQNISVNSFGSELGYGLLKNDLTKEATLMSEMAMLHFLFDLLSDENKAHYKEAIDQYKAYLDKARPDNPSYFIKSRYGKTAKALIHGIKEDIRNTPNPDIADEVVVNAKQALLNMMAHDKHFSRNNAKTMQALSVFVEQASIGGCTTGNEQAEIISKRVSVLDSLLSIDRVGGQEKRALRAALREVAREPSKSNITSLTSVLDEATNHLALQSATVAISHCDQLSGSKIKARLKFNPDLFKSPVEYITSKVDANYAENSTMSNLNQNESAENQAHEGFNTNLWKAMETLNSKGSGAENTDVEDDITRKNSYAFMSKLKKPYQESVVINGKKLCGQIGNYSYSFDTDKNGQTAFERLKAQSIDKKHKPIEVLLTDRSSFNSTHHNEVENYINHPPFVFPEFEPSSSDNYFREAFIYYLEKRLKLGQDGVKGYELSDPDSRFDDPSKAMISLRKLLGKVGEDLFKLALEEEVNSDEYREAVFNKSSTYYPGATWKYRPIIYMSGPSASGKTFSTKAAVKEASDLFEQDLNAADNMAGNFVTASDGGILRELSQIRNLVIEAAIAKGYTGISDLLKKTQKYLDPIKNKVKKAALASDDLGVAIPETFADPRIRLGFGNSVRKNEKKSSTGKKSRSVFVMVEGESGSFKQVVNYMGHSRALKREWTKDYKPQKFALNRTKAIDIPESKIYESQHFRAGLSGSKAAFDTFKKTSCNGFSIIAKNDLVLRCPVDPDDLNSSWVEGAHDSPGVVMISLRVLKRWEILQQILSSDEDAFNVSTSNMKPGKPVPSKEDIFLASKNLLKFLELSHNINPDNPISIGEQVIFGNPVLPPVIKTSAEINIVLALQKPGKKINKIQNKYGNTHAKDLLDIENALTDIYRKAPEGFNNFVVPENEDKINGAIQLVQQQIDKIKEKQSYLQKLLTKNSKYKILKPTFRNKLMNKIPNMVSLGSQV